MPQQELGPDFYLFRAENATGPSNKLIISSHGGRLLGFASTLLVPAWTKLIYYTADKVALQDPGVEPFMRWGAERHPVIEQVFSLSTSWNYELSKYQGRHSKGSETYESIRRDLDWVFDIQTNVGPLIASASQELASAQSANRSYVIKLFEERLIMLQAVQATGGPFDILTVRNRRMRFSAITLRDVFAVLQQNNLRYQEIHCLFCRSRWPV